jgi:hypothetical protein
VQVSQSSLEQARRVAGLPFGLGSVAPAPLTEPEAVRRAVLLGVALQWSEPEPLASELLLQRRSGIAQRKPFPLSPSLDFRPC